MGAVPICTGKLLMEEKEMIAWEIIIQAPVLIERSAAVTERLASCSQSASKGAALQDK